jgi:hypothetical protein
MKAGVLERAFEVRLLYARMRKEAGSGRKADE